MPEPIEWIVYRPELKDRIQGLTSELQRHIASGVAYRIEDILGELPLAPVSAGTLRRLRKRGKVSFANDRALNSGKPVDAVLEDQVLGKIGVLVPATVEAGTEIRSRESIRFAFESPRPSLTLYDLPTRLGLGTRFSIASLQLESERAVMSCDSMKDEAIHLDLVVNLTPDPNSSEEGEGDEEDLSPLAQDGIGLLRAAAAHSLDFKDCAKDAINAGDEWVVRRASMSRACYVQRKTASPIGLEQVGGPYSSRDEATAAMKQLEAEGICETS